MTSSPSRPLLPRYTRWLAITGFLVGGVVALYLNLTEPKLFESSTLINPSPPPPAELSGGSLGEWVAHEATAMRSDDTLLRAVKRLDLSQEWNKSADECLEKLREMVLVETSSGDTLIRVIARSTKSMESADIANAVVAARGEYHDEKRLRGQPKPDTAASASMRELMDVSSIKKRRALMDALAAAKLAPEYNNDSAIKNLTLQPNLDKMRADWIAETEALEKARASDTSAIASAVVPPYAEILEKAVPSINPRDNGYRTRQLTGAFGGAAAGLVLALILGRFGNPASAIPAEKPLPAPYHY